MKFVATLLAAIAGALALSCGTSMSDVDFAAIEKQWVDALREHDTKQLDVLLGDSFVDSTYRGTLRTKQDVLTGPPAGGSYHSIGFEEMKVRRFGNVAVVPGVNLLQGSSPDDVARIRFTDVFVFERGHWRAVSAQETLLGPDATRERANAH